MMTEMKRGDTYPSSDFLSLRYYFIDTVTFTFTRDERCPPAVFYCCTPEIEERSERMGLNSAIFDPSSPTVLAPSVSPIPILAA